MSPRGIGAILAMPIIGVLTNKLDARWLIACGFVMFGISSLRFGQADLAISQWSFLWAIMLSGFGSGSIFVPLSAVAVTGLANEEIGNASGLYNLSRNVGGSIGISIVNTIMARHQQLHQNELVHSVTSTACHAAKPASDAATLPANPGLQRHRIHAKGLRNNWRDGLPARRGCGRTSMIFATWRWCRFACIPIVFMLKKATPRKGAQSIGH